MDPGPSSETPAEILAQAEDLLRALPELELLGLMRHSSNYTFLARLGPDPQLLAVYKPARGESPLWDFPEGTLYRREMAAYLVARALGWPNVPPTVVRAEAPHGVGALQLFIDADPARHFLENDGVPADTWERVAVFDVLVNNADRKSGHCLAARDGRIWVIDHGLTFHAELKLRTVIWNFAGRRLPEALRPDLERARAELEAACPLGAGLAELLSRAEVRALRRRLDEILAPGWSFPQPTSVWSVPWPLV